MLQPLTKGEKALLRILTSDIHAPQFLWKQPDGVNPYRVYDYQYYFDDNDNVSQAVASCCRSVGKTEKIKRSCFTWLFRKPGKGKLITAPQEVHLNPLMELIIDKIMDIKFTRKLVKSIKRKPCYLIKFFNKAYIEGKIPGTKGNGCKGSHVDSIETDESQDYVSEGWANLRECLNEVKDKQIRAWGVPNGVRNEFFNFTRSPEFSKVTFPAMYKHTWGDKERREKIAFYGSRNAPGYIRNILAEPGAAEYLLFLPSKLDFCIDHGKIRLDGTYDKDDPKYTADYRKIQIINEDINRNMPFSHYLRFPEIHLKYKRVWVGVDFGHHGADPTEILIWAEESNKNRTKLICRVHCERVTDDDQADIVEFICKFYNVVGVACDATARGGSIWEKLNNKNLGNIILSGYNFKSVKEITKDVNDKPINIPIKQLSVEILQNMCDHREFLIPYDVDILADWMGLKMKPLSNNKFDIVKDANYKTHTLYAAAMMALQREDYRLGKLEQEDFYYEEGGWVESDGGGVPGAFN